MPSWMRGGLIGVGVVVLLGVTWGSTGGAGVVFLIPPAAIVAFALGAGIGATVSAIARRA